jgi:hypothetical protein
MLEGYNVIEKDEGKPREDQNKGGDESPPLF